MTKYQYLLVSLLTFLPAVSNAQGSSLQNLFENFLTFIFETLVPFLFGIAFLFIVINIFRYFILGGADEKAREKAKSLAIYGVAAFVFLVIFFGIVNLLSDSLGLGGKEAPTSDYQKRKPGSGGTSPDPCDPSTYNPYLCPGGV